MLHRLIGLRFPLLISDHFLSLLSDGGIQHIHIHNPKNTQNNDNNSSSGILMLRVVQATILILCREPIEIPTIDYITENLERHIHLPESKEVNSDLVPIVVGDTAPSHY